MENYQMPKSEQLFDLLAEQIVKKKLRFTSKYGEYASGYSTMFEKNDPTNTF